MKALNAETTYKSLKYFKMTSFYNSKICAMSRRAHVKMDQMMVEPKMSIQT